MNTLAVIGELEVLDNDNPITVVCVDEAAVTKVLAEVVTFFATYLVKVLLIYFPCLS